MSKLFSLFRRKPTRPVWSVVVAAAGTASRMQGIDKILAPLGDRPILARTLEVFQRCEAVSEVIVVTREDLLADISRMCKEFDLNKVKKVVVGGDERLLSVRAGLRQVDPEAHLIAIHDGARPFLTRSVLEQVLEQAARSGAAAPAIPLNDTIKRAVDGVVEETVDRSVLWSVQTPQVFQADLIRAAVEQAAENGVQVTDDCSVVERLGMKVVLTPGDRENIKVTTPFDLILGQVILDLRQEEGR